MEGITITINFSKDLINKLVTNVTEAVLAVGKVKPVIVQNDTEPILHVDEEPVALPTAVATQEQASQAPPVIEPGPVALSDMSEAAGAVELADGIPWDVRIHAGTKTKYATKPFGWKLKRGVDKDLAAQIEADLRASMAVVPPQPIEQPAAFKGDVPTPPEVAFGVKVADVVSAPETGPAPVTEQGTITSSVAHSTIKTFGELVAKLTPSGIPQATVDAACAKYDVSSFSILAANIDMIPYVAGELFPGE